MRFGELAALRWSDVDWQRDLIHVRRALACGLIEQPKSGKVRSVPMVPEVAQALAKHGQRQLWTGDDDFVFVSPTGGYIDYSATVKTYKRALRKAGLRQVKFHGLRHFYGTVAVQAFPLSDVKAWMGHAAIETTMRYVHHVPKTDAAQRLGRLLDGENVVPRVVPSTVVERSPEGVEHA